MCKPTLPYAVSFDWKVYQFANEIDLQIRSIETDIELGKVADAKKARGFVNKMKEILALSYFTKASWSNRTVRTLNKHVSDDCKAVKAQKDQVEEALNHAKDSKVKGVQISLIDVRQGGTVSNETAEEIDDRFAHLDEAILKLESEARIWNKEYKTLRFLQGMLNCSTFFDSLYDDNAKKKEGVH